jgi:hypothetical protein
MSGSYRSSSASLSGAGGRSGEPRAIRTYPSSPSISRPSYYGDGGAARSRSYSGRILSGPSSGRSYGSSPSVRSSGSSSGRSSGRVSSSSGRSSGSRGSVSSSRGSSGSRSSGGGVRKR